MDNQTTQKLQELEAKIDAIYASTEKTRKYFLWTLITTAVLFILPLIGLFFALPSFVSNYTTTLQDLSQ